MSLGATSMTVPVSSVVRRMTSIRLDALITCRMKGILATRLVSIGLPDGDPDVCRTVPRPSYLAGWQWPTVLQTIDEARVRELLSYGQPVDDASESAAPTWEEFDERMGFIVCLFRGYQRDPVLFALPPDVPRA